MAYVSKFDPDQGQSRLIFHGGSLVFRDPIKILATSNEVEAGLREFMEEGTSDSILLSGNNGGTIREDPIGNIYDLGGIVVSHRKARELLGTDPQRTRRSRVERLVFSMFLRRRVEMIKDSKEMKYSGVPSTHLANITFGTEGTKFAAVFAPRRVLIERLYGDGVSIYTH